MLMYQRIKAVIQEGGIALLFKKVGMRFFARYDKNFFFHSTPEGFPSGELTVRIFDSSDKDRDIAERILAAFHKASADEKKICNSKIICGRMG
jgi:hypothetical protein